MATNPARSLPAGLEIRGPLQSGYETILTPEAMEFVADLTRRFGDRVQALLAARAERQRELDTGKPPDFLPHTKQIRSTGASPRFRRPGIAASRSPVRPIARWSSMR